MKPTFRHSSPKILKLYELDTSTRERFDKKVTIDDVTCLVM